MIAIRINDQASPNLRALMNQVRGPVGLKVASRGVAVSLRDHFDTLDQNNPNKLGGRRIHFWRQVRRSVQTPIVRGDVGVIGINHVGIRQKIEGGEIRPVNRKFLTIPARAEAYGKRARELNLNFAVTDRGPALVEPLVTRIRFRRTKSGGTRMKAGDIEGGRVMFWLVRRVVQRPFLGALPTERTMGEAAERALSGYISAQAARRR